MAQDSEGDRDRSDMENHFNCERNAAITKQELGTRRHKGENLTYTTRSITRHGNAHDPNRINPSNDLEKYRHSMARLPQHLKTAQGQ